MPPFSRFTDYFLAAAKYGSFHKAAEALYISVSAVHRQIKLGEEMLDVQLFERLPNGLRLTAAGELFYDNLKRWEKEFAQLRLQFDEMKGLRRGTVQMGIIEALGDGGFLLPIIRQLKLTYPWLDIELNISSSTQITAQIMHADIDFGLILEPALHPDLEVLAFVELPVGIAVAATHPLANARKPLSLAQFADDCHIMPRAPLTIAERVEALYAHARLTPQSTIACNDIRMILNLVHAGVGVAVLSGIDIYHALNHHDVAFLALKDRSLHPITVALCCAPKRQLSKAAQVYIHAISAAMEKMKRTI